MGHAHHHDKRQENASEPSGSSYAATVAINAAAAVSDQSSGASKVIDPAQLRAEQVASRLREDRILAKHLPKNESAEGFRILSSAGPRFSIAEFAQLIQKRPPADTVISALSVIKRDGFFPISSSSDGRLTIAAKIDPKQSPQTLASNILLVINDQLIERLRIGLKMELNKVNLMLVAPEIFEQLPLLVSDPAERAKILNSIEDDKAARETVFQSIRAGVVAKASDVHIEPVGNDARIRLRINGVLETRSSPRGELLKPMIAVIKNIAKMRLEERRMPQDGTIRFDENDLKLYPELKGYTVRVSVVPSVFGESAVMRLLKPSNESQFDITQIGLSEKLRKRIEQVVDAPQGLVLVTGPTGSGKTTLLYSVLRKLNTEDTKILTVEEPVEVSLPGITQVEVRNDIELSFAKVLRSFLRQDPDIILVGEIRDEETARTAVQAALTGHLVFATLHTNDAFGVIPRLLSLNVDPENIQSALRGVIAQRLVRGLCDTCKETKDRKDELNELLGQPAFKEPIMLAAPPDDHTGCRDCAGTGFKSRIPTAELWVPAADERAIIMSGETNVERLAEKAQLNGMETMFFNALEHVKLRKTSLKEVLRNVVSLEEFRANSELVIKMFGARGSKPQAVQAK